jgi:hypothetical protein
MDLSCARLLFLYFLFLFLTSYAFCILINHPKFIYIDNYFRISAMNMYFHDWPVIRKGNKEFEEFQSWLALAIYKKH